MTNIFEKRNVMCTSAESDDVMRQAQYLLVVVQHSVHVLNPDGVDRTVENDPLPVCVRV